MEFALGNHIFRTKGEAKTHINQILFFTPINDKLEGERLHTVLALLDMHPNAAEKIGCGVKDIYVRKGYGTGQFFEILRTDGSKIDFSYRKCFDGINRNTALAAAFRFEIKPQISAFRASLHIHHVLPFKDIFSNFLNEYGIDSDAIPIKSNGIEVAIDDPELSELWRQYHANNAQLKALTEEEHRQSH